MQRVSSNTDMKTIKEAAKESFQDISGMNRDLTNVIIRIMAYRKGVLLLWTEKRKRVWES